jgi:hypothetical protein
MAEGEELASNLLLVAQSSVGESNADPGFGTGAAAGGRLNQPYGGSPNTLQSTPGCRGPKALWIASQAWNLEQTLLVIADPMLLPVKLGFGLLYNPLGVNS